MRLLRQGLRANPIVGKDGFVGLVEEAVDLRIDSISVTSLRLAKKFCSVKRLRSQNLFRS
jgi:hypothetical protein